MDFLEQLRAQKREGENELAATQAAERARETEEAARVRAKEDNEKAREVEKDRRRAEQVFAGLPELVRKATRQGQRTAILSEGSVSDRPPGDKPSRAVIFNRRTFYLMEWQIPFYDRCREEGVPLTIVSERVNVGLRRVLRRDYHFLAIDIDLL